MPELNSASVDFADHYKSTLNLAYDSRSKVSSVIEEDNKTIERQPDYAESYHNRGVAYNNKGEYDRAIVYFDIAIEHNPNYAEAYYNRGTAYSESGELDRAIEAYSTAIELKPNYAEAYNNRGEAWLHLGGWDNARSDLNTAKQLGMDIIAAFRNDYESVLDFKEKNGIQLPADIAAMLTPKVTVIRKTDLQQQAATLIEQLSTEKLELAIDYLTVFQAQERAEATHGLAGDSETDESSELKSPIKNPIARRVIEAVEQSYDVTVEDAEALIRVIKENPDTPP